MKRKMLINLLVVLFGVLFILSSGCTENSGTTNEEDVYHFEFNPDNFVNPLELTNEYMPLTPGTQLIYTGTTEVGSRKVPHQIIETVTDVVRTIDGVPAIAVLDQGSDSGEITQVGFDYFAIDKDKNVWILGGYTEEYESGEYIAVDTASLGEATGGKVGVLVPGVVTMDTNRWFVGTPGPEEDPSVAEPVEIGADVTVQYGTFHNVWAVREGEIGAIDNEIKYYAPEVGVVLNKPFSDSIHQDDFHLVNIVQLTPEGLAEASQVVLDLEIHAIEVAPEVYANAAPAKQILSNGTIVDIPGLAELYISKTTTETTVDTSASDVPQISESEAEAIALEAVPGEVTDIEISTYAGVKVYVVQVDAISGTETDVIIDRETGEVLRTEI